MFGFYPFGAPYFGQGPGVVQAVFGAVELDFDGAGEQTVGGSGAGLVTLDFSGAAHTAVEGSGTGVSGVEGEGSRR